MALDLDEILNPQGDGTMTRAILLAALLTHFAAAQAPPAPPAPPMVPASPAPAPPKENYPKSLVTKPKLTLDQIITAAMHTNPDVKIAEAEVQLAQAKLAAVKVAATLKVTALKDAIDECEQKINREKLTLARCEEMLAEYHKSFSVLKASGNASSVSEMTAAKADVSKAEASVSASKANLDSLQAKLARHQQEWKRLSEAAVNTPTHMYISTYNSDSNTTFYNAYPYSYLSTVPYQDFRNSSLTTPLVGSTNDGGSVLLSVIKPVSAKTEPESLQGKLRLALDKPIAFELTSKMTLDDVLNDFFKKADLKIQVFEVKSLGMHALQNFIQMKLQPATMPLGSWFQLVTDCLNDGNEVNDKENRIEFYVRDYGLQLADKKTAAPGAIPLSEFWKSPKPETAPPKK